MPDIAWIKSEFLRALRALAADGARALDGYPDGAAKADELAGDYSHFLDCLVANCPDLLEPEQLLVLRRIDSQLDGMSGPANVALWSDDAVRSHVAWAKVRAEARAVVDAIDVRLR